MLAGTLEQFETPRRLRAWDQQVDSLLRLLRLFAPSLLMDVDVFEHGWEHLPDYRSNHSNSTLEGGGSQTTLSPSLQSYLNVNNNNNTNPSWAGGGSAFSPYQQPNPTSIRHIDIARTARRRGPSWIRSNTRGNSGSLLHQGGASLGPSTHATPGSYGRSISDVKSAENNPHVRRAAPVNAQYKNILERGWDGRMALGRRTGAERRLLAAHLATSASAPCFEERQQQNLAAPKSWDNSRMRGDVRSAGPSRTRGSIIFRDNGTSFQDPDRSRRDADQTGDGASIRSGGDGRVQSRRPRTAPGLQPPPPRLSPSGPGGRTRARSRALSGSDSGTMGMQHAGGGGFAGMSRSGVTEERVPELSRSLSPSPQTNRHLPPFTSSSFGPSRHNTEESARRQARFVTVRALSLFPGGSIGHEVSAVGISPFNSVRSLRAAIHSDIDRRTRSTIDAGGGGGGGGGGSSSSPSPAFLFSYADGVPIDRGQEDRLSVQDIAIASSPSSRATNNANPRGEEEEGRGRSAAEACVFVRACSYQNDELETGDGLHEGGVLSRWGSLQGGSCESEAFPLDDSAGGNPDHLLSNGQGSLSPPVKHANSCFYGGSEELHWSGGGRGSPTALGTGALNVWSPQRAQRRMSVSFDESKAARRQRILDQVERLAASKATTIAKVCRGHHARVLFRGRLNRHQKALTIQLCVRRWTAWLELKHRARCRRETALLREGLLRRDRQDAALCIQCNARKMAARLEFLSRRRMREAVVVLQCWARLKGAKTKAGLQVQRSAALSLKTTADPTSAAKVEKQEAPVAGESFTNEPLAAERTTHAVAAPSVQRSVVEMEEDGVSMPDKPDVDISVPADEVAAHEVAPSSQGPGVELKEVGASAEGEPGADGVVLADETTAHEISPSSQGPDAEVTEGEASVADELMLAADAIDHEMAPSSHGSQSEILMAAAEEGEVLQKGVAGGKEVSAATMDPLDTVPVSAEEPHLDGVERGVSEPERVTSECSAATDHTVTLGVEERAAACDEEHLHSEAATGTERMLFTANEDAPSDQGGVVVSRPAAAVPVGDEPVVDESFDDAAQPITVATEEVFGTAIEETFSSAAPHGEPVVDVAYLNLKPELEALAGQDDCANSGSLDDLTPSAEDIVGVAKDVDNAAQLPSAVKKGIAPTSARDESWVDGSTSGEVASGDTIAVVEEPFVVSASDDPPLSTTEAVGSAEDAEVSQPTPAATQETLATAIKHSSSTNAEVGASADGYTLEEVAPGQVTTTAEDLVVVPASDNPPWSAAEVVEDAEQSSSTSAASTDRAVTAIKDNAPTDALSGASVEQPVSEVAVSESISQVAAECAISPVSCGNTRPMRTMTDDDVELSTPEAGEETSVAAIEDSDPNAISDESITDEPASNTLQKERITLAAEESVADLVSNDLITSPPQETSTVEAADTAQSASVNMESSRVIAMEENAQSVVRDEESAGEPAPTTPAPEEPISQEISGDPTSVGGEASETLEGAEIPPPTSVVLEETLVAEIEDRTGTNTTDPMITDEPASTIPAPEDMTRGVIGPVAVSGTADLTLVSVGIPRKVEDTGAAPLTPVTGEEVIGEEVLVVANQISASSAPDYTLPEQPTSEIAPPERSEMASDETVDISVTVGPTSAATDALGMVENADVEQLSFSGAEKYIAGAEEEHSSTVSLGEEPADKPSLASSPPEQVAPATERSVDVPVTGELPLALTDTLGLSEEVGFKQPALAAGEETTTAARQVSITTDATDGVSAQQSALEATAEYSATATEEKLASPITDDLALSAAEATGMTVDADIGQPLPVSTEEVHEFDVEGNTRAITPDQAPADEPTYLNRSLVHATPAAEGWVAVAATGDPSLIAAEALGMEEDAGIEQSIEQSVEHPIEQLTPVNGEDTPSLAVEDSVPRNVPDQTSADEQPALIVPSPQDVARAAEGNAAVQVLEDPDVLVADGLRSEEAADLDRTTSVAGEETLVAPVEVVATSDAMNGGASSALEYGTVTDGEKITALTIGDPESPAAEALEMLTDDDGAQANPVRAEEMLAGAGAIEVGPLPVLLDDTSAAEPDHSPPALVHVAAVTKEYVAVSVTDESTPPVKQSPGEANETNIEQPPSRTADETLEAAILENSPAIVPRLVSTDEAESALEIGVLESETPVTEESVVSSELGDPTPSTAVAVIIGGSVDDAPQPIRAGAGEMNANAVEVSVAMFGVDGVPADEPTDTTPSSEDVASAATVSVAVPVTADPLLAAEEIPETGDDAGIEQSDLVVGQETLVATIKADGAPTNATDPTLAEYPALEITMPEHSTNTAEAQVAAPITDDSFLTVSETLDMEEGSDAEGFTPLAGEMLVASKETSFTVNAADCKSTEQPAFETSTPRHITQIAEELVSALVMVEPATPATEVLGMEGDAHVEQPNPVAEEHIAEEHIAEEHIAPTPNYVATTEETTLLTDPYSALNQKPDAVTSALGYVPPETEEPVSGPATSDLILPETATSEVEEGADGPVISGMEGDADVEQSTPVTQGAIPVASAEECVSTSGRDESSAEEQCALDTAAVEHVSTTPEKGIDASATSGPISLATDALGAVRDAGIEQPTPAGAEDTLAGAIEEGVIQETARTIVLGGASADESASVAAASECVSAVAEEAIAPQITDGPTSAGKDNMGMAESPEADQYIAVPEQEMFGAAMEQSPRTVVLDEALDENIPSTVSSPMCVAPAALSPSPAEAASVAADVAGSPILSAAETSGAEGGSDVGQSSPVARESAPVAVIEDNSASTIVLEEELAENIAFGVAAPKHVFMSAEQPVVVLATSDSSLSAEETRAMTEGVDIEKSSPAITGETVTEIEDGDVLYGASTETPTSNLAAPEYGASLAAKDPAVGRKASEYTMPAAEDSGQAVNDEVGQSATEEALGAATEDYAPTSVLNAVSTGNPYSVSATPEHEASAKEKEELVNDLDGFTSSARGIVGMVEDAEAMQPAPEVAKDSLAAAIEGVAPDIVLGAAGAEESTSMTAVLEHVAPAAEDTVSGSVSGDATSSVDILGISEDAEVENPIAVAGEEDLVAATDASGIPGDRDGAIAEDPAFTVDVDTSGHPATEDSLAGQELGNGTLSIGELASLNAEDALEAPADEASAAIAEDSEAQQNVAEIEESQRVEAPTQEVVAEAPVMRGSAEIEIEPSVTGEQASTAAVVGNSVHTVAHLSPMPAERSLKLATRTEEVPESGESVAVVLAVDGGTEVSVDTYLAATMANGEADEDAAGSAEVLSVEEPPTEVADEQSATVGGTEIKQRLSGTGDQMQVNQVEGIDSPAAVDEEVIAEGLPSVTSLEVDAGPTSEEPLTSPKTDDPILSVIESPSFAVDGAIEESEEHPLASMTEDAEVHQIVDGTVEGDTAEVSAPLTTTEILGTMEDAQGELPPLVAKEEVQALVPEGYSAENLASMTHIGNEATAGQPLVKTAVVVNGTPAAEKPFEDQTLGDPVLWVDGTSVSAVGNPVNGSADKESVEVVDGVAAYEAGAQATEGKRDGALAPNDIDQLSRVADELDMKQPVPLSDEAVSETTAAEPGFVTATEGEATPVAKEPLASAGFGGPTLPMDNSSVFRTDADGDVSVDQASVENAQKDEVREVVSSSTQEIEEKSPALEEPHTQPVPDVSTSCVNSASTLEVDTSIGMVVGMPTMAVNEDIEVSQAAAHSAEGSSVEGVTPELVDISPEISSTSVQEEVVPAAEELPTDAVVVNDAPSTADDSKSEIGYPVNGEETVVTGAEDIATIIQNGGITEEPASASGPPPEGAPTSPEPLTNGFLTAASPPVDEESVLFIAHDVDGPTNKSPDENIEGGEIRQISTDGSDDRAVGVPASEVAAEALEMTPDPEVEEDSPMIGEETPVATIRDGMESATNEVSATTEENRGSEAQHPDVVLAESEPAGVLDAEADEESRKAGQEEGGTEVVASAIVVGDEAPLATSEESGPPASTEGSGPIATLDKLATDLERSTVGGDAAVADETTPLAEANEDATPPAEETLAKGLVPEGPTFLPDVGYSATSGAIGESADQTADELSAIVDETGEDQQIVAEMSESVQVDVLTPDVNGHETALTKDIEPEQAIPAESPSSLAAGKNKSTPGADDFITDVMPRGSTSLNDGISVGAAVETAEVPGVLDVGADTDSRKAGQAEGGTEVVTPATVVGDEAPLATSEESGPPGSTERSGPVAGLNKPTTDLERSTGGGDGTVADETTPAAEANKDATQPAKETLARGLAPEDPTSLLDVGYLATSGDIGESVDKTTDELSAIVDETGEDQLAVGGDAAVADETTPLAEANEDGIPPAEETLARGLVPEGPTSLLDVEYSATSGVIDESVDKTADELSAIVDETGEHQLIVVEMSEGVQVDVLTPDVNGHETALTQDTDPEQAIPAESTSSPAAGKDKSTPGADDFITDVVSRGSTSLNDGTAVGAAVETAEVPGVLDVEADADSRKVGQAEGGTEVVASAIVVGDEAPLATSEESGPPASTERSAPVAGLDKPTTDLERSTGGGDGAVADETIPAAEANKDATPPTEETLARGLAPEDPTSLPDVGYLATSGGIDESADQTADELSAIVDETGEDQLAVGGDAAVADETTPLAEANEDGIPPAEKTLARGLVPEGPTSLPDVEYSATSGVIDESADKTADELSAIVDETGEDQLIVAEMPEGVQLGMLTPDVNGHETALSKDTEPEQAIPAESTSSPAAGKDESTPGADDFITDVVSRRSTSLNDGTAVGAAVETAEVSGVLDAEADADSRKAGQAEMGTEVVTPATVVGDEAPLATSEASGPPGSTEGSGPITGLDKPTTDLARSTVVGDGAVADETTPAAEANGDATPPAFETLARGLAPEDPTSIVDVGYSATSGGIDESADQTADELSAIVDETGEDQLAVGGDAAVADETTPLAEANEDATPPAEQTLARGLVPEGPTFLPDVGYSATSGVIGESADQTADELSAIVDETGEDQQIVVEMSEGVQVDVLTPDVNGHEIALTKDIEPEQAIPAESTSSPAAEKNESTPGADDFITDVMPRGSTSLNDGTAVGAAVETAEVPGVLDVEADKESRKAGQAEGDTEVVTPATVVGDEAPLATSEESGPPGSTEGSEPIAGSDKPTTDLERSTVGGDGAVADETTPAAEANEGATPPAEKTLARGLVPEGPTSLPDVGYSATSGVIDESVDKTADELSGIVDETGEDQQIVAEMSEGVQVDVLTPDVNGHEMTLTKDTEPEQAIPAESTSFPAAGKDELTPGADDFITDVVSRGSISLNDETSVAAAVETAEVSGVLDVEADEKSRKAGQAEGGSEVVTPATVVGGEAPLATSEESGPPASTEGSGPIAGSDKPTTDLERSTVGGAGAVADETTPLAEANEEATPPAEETLARGLVPEGPTSLPDVGYLATSGATDASADQTADELSAIVDEAGEDQLIVAEMPEGVQADVLAPDVNGNEMALMKDTDPEQALTAESTLFPAAGKDESTPGADDFITDVVLRGSISLNDGTSVGAAVETAEVSAVLDVEAEEESREAGQAEGGTEVVTPATVVGDETPLATSEESGPPARTEGSGPIAGLDKPTTDLERSTVGGDAAVADETTPAAEANEDVTPPAEETLARGLAPEDPTSIVDVGYLATSGTIDESADKTADELSAIVDETGEDQLIVAEMPEGEQVDVLTPDVNGHEIALTQDTDPEQAIPAESTSSPATGKDESTPGADDFIADVVSRGFTSLNHGTSVGAAVETAEVSGVLDAEAEEESRKAGQEEGDTEVVTPATAVGDEALLATSEESGPPASSEGSGPIAGSDKPTTDLERSTVGGDGAVADETTPAAEANEVATPPALETFARGLVPEDPTSLLDVGYLATSGVIDESVDTIADELSAIVDETGEDQPIVAEMPEGVQVDVLTPDVNGHETAPTQDIEPEQAIPAESTSFPAAGKNESTPGADDFITDVVSRGSTSLNDGTSVDAAVETAEVSGVLDAEADEESRKAGQAEGGTEVVIHSTAVGDEAPLSTSEESGPPASTERSGPMAGLDKPTTDLERSIVGGDEAVADETTPAAEANEDATPPAEETLARGLAPEDSTSLLDVRYLATFGAIGESADKTADELSAIVDEAGEDQQIVAEMPEGVQMDVLTPDVNDHEIVLMQDTDPEQTIPAESVSSPAAGKDEPTPGADDFITDVVSRGFTSLNDGTSVGAAVETAEVSEETPLTATIADVEGRQATICAAERGLPEVLIPEDSASVNAAAGTEIDTPALVGREETPVAEVGEGVHTAVADDGTVVEESSNAATAEEQDVPVTDTAVSSTAALNKTSTVDISLGSAEEQEAPNNEESPADDVVSGDTPSSLGESFTPIRVVVDAVEDTDFVCIAHRSVAEQPIPSVSVQENVPIVPAAEESIPDIVAECSIDVALGSADETLRESPSATTVNVEGVQEVPEEATGNRRENALLPEAAEEASMAEKEDGVESAPVGEETFVSAFEDSAPIVAPGEGTADNHASFKEQGGIATPGEEHLPEEPVDNNSGAVIPAMENDAGQPAAVAADDGAALEDKGNTAEDATEMLEAPLTEPLDKTLEEAPASPQISELAVGEGDTLAVGDEAAARDEEGSAAIVTMGEAKVLTAAPNGFIEPGASDFAALEGTVVPQPVYSLDADIGESMGDERSVESPAVEAGKHVPLASDRATVQRGEATAEQPQEQAATSTPTEQPFAKTSNEAEPGVSSGADATLEDDAAGKEVPRATTEIEEEDGHTLPNAVIEEGNGGLPAAEAAKGVSVD